jgi:tRNA threonylcarbamoyl adenosine modification protein YeaZ
MASADAGPFLGLDTACPRAMVCVFDQSGVLSEIQLEKSRRHAEEIPGALKSALKAAGISFSDLGAVVVGVGPGSFVGVRVGLATAKGIALALKIPLFGVGSLHALASQPGLPLGLGLGLIDARRAEVYAATFERVETERGIWARPQKPASALAPDAVPEICPQPAFQVGNGVSLLGQGAPGADPTVSDLAGVTAEGLRLAALQCIEEADLKPNLHGLLPHYVRAPDAKLPGGKLPASPIVPQP